MQRWGTDMGGKALLAILVAQAVIMWPVSVHYAVANDPGLEANVEVRRGRLRTVPIVLSAGVLGIAGALGDFRDVALLWAVFVVLGWSMKRHPEDARKLQRGGLPSLPMVLTILIGVVVGAGAIALGDAVP